MLRIHGLHTDDFPRGDGETSDAARKLQRNVAELVRRIDGLHQEYIY